MRTRNEVIHDLKALDKSVKGRQPTVEENERNAALQKELEEIETAVSAPAVIRHPFKGLKTGVQYHYARPNWPAPQTGTAHKNDKHTAEVKELTFKDGKSGALITEQQVQLGGKGRLYPLIELPLDATFTEI